MRDYRTMTEIAATELRKAIQRGDLVAGTRLIPAKLEAEMDLSRVSIREAIRELVGTGLVESTTHKGAYVAEPLDLSEIKEIFKVRYEVEGRAAFLGTKKITEEGIARLEELIEEAEKGKSDDIKNFFLNYEFHMTLYRATGWRYLIKMIERIYDQVIACRGSVYRQLREQYLNNQMSFTPFKRFHADHIEILQAVKDNKPVIARDLTVKNLKRGLSNIIELYDQL